MTRKPFIALDFDGVLHDSTDHWERDHVIPNGPVLGSIEFLRDLIEDRRFLVCVVTSRVHGKGGKQAVSEWLAPHLTKLQLEDIHIVADCLDAHVTLSARSMTFCGAFPSMDWLMAFAPYDKKPAHLRSDPETAMAVADSIMMQIGQIAKDAGCPNGEAPLDFIRTRISPTYREPDGQDWSDEALRLSAKIAADKAAHWEPAFCAESRDQERLAIEFSSEVCNGGRPDAVRILEMADALYRAERDDLLQRAVAPADDLSAAGLAPHKRTEMIGDAISHWLSGGGQGLAFQRRPDRDGAFEWKVRFDDYHIFMPELAFAGCTTQDEARRISISYLDAFRDGRALERSKVTG